MNNKIVDKCEGCSHIQEDNCKIWNCPAAKWKLGICPSATHVDRGLKKVEEKVRIGQQKSKKKK
jgi:hypothetical protein